MSQTAKMHSTDNRYDAFLSYARADDQAFRKSLLDSIGQRGYRIWFDRESMPNRGTAFGQEIRRAIEISDRLILLAGPAALVSEYVAQEWGYADDIGKPIVPVVQTITFRDLPDRLHYYHGIDAGQLTMDVVVAELSQLLAEPVRPLGTCFHLPHRLLHTLDRPELIARLTSTILPDQLPPQDAGRAPRVAVLYGISGVGKSTLAAAFASAIRTRRVFSDGVAWLTGGPGFQLLTAARELLQMVTPGARLPETDSEVDITLASALSGRELLIVLDDVRDPNTALPFIKSLGPGGRVLITTLDQAVATTLGAVEIAVEQLDEESSRRLLADWTGGALPPEAEIVLEACDGLPFALAIVGSMIANRTPWAVVAQTLNAQRLDLLAGQFPEYPHRTVLRVLAASFDALAADDPHAADCYLELAAFQPGAVLTQSVLIRLWSRPGRLSSLEAELVLPVLERRLLLHRTQSTDRFTLHHLHESFVRLRHPNPTELTTVLIASYRADKGQADWANLDDDGYIFDNLIGHLVTLNDRTTLVEVVTKAWVQRQWLRRGDLGQALEDVRRAISLVVKAPIDLASITRLSVLSGQISATLRTMPSGLIAALADVGDIDQALQWAGDQPDAPKRFAALEAVAAALLKGSALTLASRVCRIAAETIASLGTKVEAGFLPALTALNAVHVLVNFPHPDQWEGTNDEMVSAARRPLDALVDLAPLTWQVGAIADLTTVTNPFWELYGHLLPLVAIEELAAQGELTVAEALLDAYPQPVSEDNESDRVTAARYRYAVAAAAVGQFEVARAAIEDLPSEYQAVGRRGLARNLARTGRTGEAVDLLGSIDDGTVAEDALFDIVNATLARAVPQECQQVAAIAEVNGQFVAADQLTAAAGDPGAGRRFMEAENAVLALQVGVSIADIYWRSDAKELAVETVRRLVPIAERVLGPQWWAPDTLNASQELADPAAMLATLLVRTGEPMPEGFVPVTWGIESVSGVTPYFKLTFIRELVTSRRFSEAMELTSVNITPESRALGLAYALAAVDASSSDSELNDQVQAAARDLTEELGQIAGSEVLDGILVAVLFVHGLKGEFSALADALDTRTDLPEALGARAVLLAQAGRTKQLRELAHRFLTARMLVTPDAKARALVLAAVAARRDNPSSELAAAIGLLAEPYVAAGALDVLAEVIDVYSRNSSLDATATLARSIPTGPVAALADLLPSRKPLQYQQGITDGEIAAAAAARAVSAATMVLVAVRAGRRRAAKNWLRLAEQFVEGVDWLYPNSNIHTVVARYMWAAQYTLDLKMRSEITSLAARVAWYLWDRGHRLVAVRYARTLLDSRPKLLVDLQQNDPLVIWDPEEFLRDSDMEEAVRACLIALQVMAVADNDQEQAREIAAKINLEKLRGLPSLTFAERAESHALVAIGLHRAGKLKAAMEMLQLAVESSMIMARRGELAPFERLCQALVELLPSDEAALIWAQWLQAAAQSDSYHVLGMIASYVRWLPVADLAGIVVNPETGDLELRPR